MLGGNLKMSVLKLITAIDTVETYLNNHSIKDIKVLNYILVTIYLLLIRTSKQIFSSRNI